MRNALTELEDERKRRQGMSTGKRSLASGVVAFACDMGEPIMLSTHRKLGPFDDAQEDGEPQYEASSYDEQPSGSDDGGSYGGSDEDEDAPRPAPAPPPPPAPQVLINVAGGGSVTPSAAPALSQAKARATAQAAPRPAPKRQSSPDALTARLHAAERSSPGAHGVFDRMNMGMATTYDAGAFDLLDQLDAKLASGGGGAAPAPKPKPAAPAQKPAPAEAPAPPANAAPPTHDCASEPHEEEAAPIDHAEALEDLALIREALGQPSGEGT